MNLGSITLKHISIIIFVATMLIHSSANATIITETFVLKVTSEVNTLLKDGMEVSVAVTYSDVDEDISIYNADGELESTHVSSDSPRYDKLFSDATFDLSALEESITDIGSFGSWDGSAILSQFALAGNNAIYTGYDYVYKGVHQTLELADYTENSTSHTSYIYTANYLDEKGEKIYSHVRFDYVSSVTEVTAVDEPSILALMSLGLLGMFGVNRRKVQV